ALPQGRAEQALVLRFLRPARKRDLAPVVLHGLGAPREEDVEPALAHEERHQHARPPQLPFVRSFPGLAAGQPAADLLHPARHAVRAASAVDFKNASMKGVGPPANTVSVSPVSWA